MQTEECQGVDSNYTCWVLITFIFLGAQEIVMLLLVFNIDIYCHSRGVWQTADLVPQLCIIVLFKSHCNWLAKPNQKRLLKCYHFLGRNQLKGCWFNSHLGNARRNNFSCAGISWDEDVSITTSRNQEFGTLWKQHSILSADYIILFYTFIQYITHRTALVLLYLLSVFWPDGFDVLSKWPILIHCNPGIHLLSNPSVNNENPSFGKLRKIKESILKKWKSIL